MPIVPSLTPWLLGLYIISDLYVIFLLIYNNAPLKQRPKISNVIFRSCIFESSPKQLIPTIWNYFGNKKKIGIRSFLPSISWVCSRMHNIPKVCTEKSGNHVLLVLHRILWKPHNFWIYTDLLEWNRNIGLHQYYQIISDIWD